MWQIINIPYGNLFSWGRSQPVSCASPVILHYTRRNAIKSVAAALTYHWRAFPRCLLMHFIVFTGASWELTASIWLPHWGTSQSNCGTAKPRSTSPCLSLPLSVVVLRLFLCAGRALPCYMQGSQDVSIDHLPTGQCSRPHPLPSPTPAVPTPTTAINIIYQYHIFFCGFSFTRGLLLEPSTLRFIRASRNTDAD